MLYRFILVFSFIAMIFLIACGDSSDTNSAISSDTVNKTDKLQLAVVNYPLQFFAEQIGGEHVSVYFPVQDEDPAYWQPDSEAIQTFQKTDVIFLNGAGYAKWIQYATLPEDKLINTSAGFNEQFISIEDDMKHNHGPKGEHSHGALAFTTWLDLKQAIKQAQIIHQSLVQLRPELKIQFDNNAQTLIQQLQTLDQELIKLSSEQSSIPVVFSHPVYQYFQRAYGLTGFSLHWEPDSLPLNSQFEELNDWNSHNAQWMIWEAEPLPETRQKLEAMNIQSIVFNPIANSPTEGDFLSAMKQNLNKFRQLTQMR